MKAKHSIIKSAIGTLFFLVITLTANAVYAISVSNDIVDWAHQYGHQSCDKFIEEMNNFAAYDEYSLHYDEFSLHFGMFVAPNERNPCIALNLFEAVPQNRPVITVGTERGFIAAAATKASHLMMADISKSIIVFNTINSLLLKASDDKNDYQQLRLKATAEDWSKRFSQKGIRFEAENQYEAIRSLWNFWYNRVRHGNFNGDFATFHNNSKEEFVNVNYLNEEDFYSHLKWMADNDRIVTFLQDVRVIKKDSRLAQYLNQMQSKIGLIDVSNMIHIEAYCYNVYQSRGRPWFEHDSALMLILSVEPYLDDESIFLNTNLKTASLAGCREYLLNNLGVIKEIDIDEANCLKENIMEKEYNGDFDSYYSIRAKGLLPALAVDVKNFEPLAQLILDYENRKCKTNESEESAQHPFYKNPYSIDYSIEPFLFKNWGPRCMIDAENWPISRSSRAKDGHRCEPITK